MRISSNVCLVIAGDLAQVDLVTAHPFDLVTGMSDRRQHPDPEDVELGETQLLDVVLVGLQHREPAVALLHRDAVGEIGRGQDDAARMQREVAREAVDRGAELEQAVRAGLASRFEPDSSGRRSIAAGMSLARIRGNALATRSISSGGRLRALPTSRIAMRARNVSTMQQIAVCSAP